MVAHFHITEYPKLLLFSVTLCKIFWRICRCRPWPWILLLFPFLHQPSSTHALTAALSPTVPVVWAQSRCPASASWWRFLSTRGSSQPLSMSAVSCSACCSKSPKLEDMMEYNEKLTFQMSFFFKIGCQNESYQCVIFVLRAILLRSCGTVRVKRMILNVAAVWAWILL